MDWTPDAETAKTIRHYALQNAIEYEGKGQAGSVIGRLMGERSDLRQHGRYISPIVAKAVLQANELAQEEGLEVLMDILETEAPHLLEKRVKERREGLPELPNAVKGKVVLRFAPNPNGPLSFGHGRGVVINSQYAEMYDGELILRFDDTDTSKKPPLPLAYEQIPKEIEWLAGFKPHRIIFASDRIETYYKYAEEMLEMAAGYTCTCSGEEFKEFRISKSNCPCRSNSVEENLKKWNMMLNGDYKPGDAVLRVKTDMTNKNPALRDWPAFRMQDTTANPHPREGIGSKYRVWPLLDFQSAVEDHLQGVTHIIRGKDLMDSTRKQVLLYEHFGWEYPETIYWGRVKVHEFGGFSTSQMRADIEEGIWSGWDDPCLPTMATLQRRGIKAKALRDFWVELGLTQKDIAVPLSSLFAHNIKQIDKTAPRLSFVRNPVEIEIGQALNERVDSLSLRVHPNEELGTRHIDLEWKNDGAAVFIEDDDCVANSQQGMRLKDWCDIGPIGEGHAEIISIEPSEKLAKIHWVSKGGSSPATLMVPKGKELHLSEGLLENHQYPVGTIVQLERVGYARIESDSQLIYVHD